MNVTLELAEETCRKARHFAVDENTSLSGWVASLIDAEVARRERGARGLKTLAEALTLPDAPDWLYEKEFPLEERKAVAERNFSFDEE